MNDTQALQIRIFKKAVIISCILIFLSLFLKNLDISVGITAGFFIGLFHFKMIVLSAKRLAGTESIKLAKFLSFLGVLLRFAILAVLFWLAIIKGASFFIGTVIGFFTIKLSITLECLNKKLLWRI